MTEFQVGKGTAWTAEETAVLDAKFAALAPNGRMVGPNGRSLIMTGSSQQPTMSRVEDTPRAIEAPPPVHHDTQDYTPLHHDQVSHRYASPSPSKHSRRGAPYAPSVNAAPPQSVQPFYSPTPPNIPLNQHYTQPEAKPLPPTLLYQPTPLPYPALPRSALSHHSHHPTHANDPNHPHAHFAPSPTDAGPSTSRRLSRTPAPGTPAASARLGSFKSITSRFKKTKETTV